MSKLIALVATAVCVGGVRTVIQPGDELPGLSAHDERELLQAGAAQNPQDTEAQVKADARATAAADAEFIATRERVQQAQASTQAENAAADGAAQSKQGSAGADDKAPAKPVKAARK